MERNPSTRLRTYTMQQGQYAVPPIGRRRRTTIRRVRGGQRQSGVYREPSLRQQQGMSALNNRLSQLSGHSHHSHHSQQRPLSTLNSDDEQLADGEEQVVQPRQSTFQRHLSQAKKIISFLGGRYSVKLDSDNRDSQIEEGVDGDIAIGGSDDNNRDRGRVGTSFELVDTTIDNDRRATNGAGDSGLPLPSKRVTILIPTDKDQDKLLTKLEPESREDDKFVNGNAGSEITTPDHSEDTVDGIGGLLVVSGGVVPAKVKSIAWEDKCVSTSDLEDYDEDNLYDDEDMLSDALTEIEERDYNNEVTFYPPPVFLLLISALEIGLFYTQETRANYYLDSQLMYNPCKRQEAWPRYLTYIFAHRNVWHLFGNMVAQVCMGSMMELVHTWRIPIIYLGSAVGGCLMHSMIDGTTYVSGASGGVFGLIGARVADILLNFPEMRHVVFKYYGWCRCSCNYEAQRGGAFVVFRRLIFGKFGQLLFALVCSSYAIYDFAAAIYSHVTNAHNTTSYGAHLGGLIVGVLLGTLVLKNIHHEQWETILKHVPRGALAFYVLFAVAWNIFYPHLWTATSEDCARYYYSITPAPAPLTDAEYQ